MKATTGQGLIPRLVRGYTFISRHYRPGDSIYLIGFSRGSYTVRALSGLILDIGLLDNAAYDPNDKEHAYQLGTQAWYMHQENLKPARLTAGVDTPIAKIARLFTTLSD